jgi:agmatinase
LVTELLAGLSLTKKGKTEGSPVRPNFYRGKGHTYDFGNAPKSRPRKRKR